MVKTEVIWVLSNLLTLKAGYWPDPDWSTNGRRPRRFKAQFVGPCELAAEVEMRLLKCGVDGFLTKQRIAWGESYRYMEQQIGIDRDRAARGVSKALSYVSGKWPKQPYRDYRVPKLKAVKA